MVSMTLSQTIPSMFEETCGKNKNSNFTDFFMILFVSFCIVVHLDHVADRDVGLEVAVTVQGDHVVIAVNADVSLSADECSSLDIKPVNVLSTLIISLNSHHLHIDYMYFLS